MVTHYFCLTIIIGKLRHQILYKIMSDKYIDIDTLKYMLYDIHKLENLLDRERFVDHDKESLDMF